MIFFKYQQLSDRAKIRLPYRNSLDGGSRDVRAVEYYGNCLCKYYFIQLVYREKCLHDGGCADIKDIWIKAGLQSSCSNMIL